MDNYIWSEGAKYLEKEDWIRNRESQSQFCGYLRDRGNLLGASLTQIAPLMMMNSCLQSLSK